MNISMQLAVVVAAACLCLADAAPDSRLARKSQRPTRGFKNVEMMTARGFGKRDRPPTRSEQSEGYAAPARRTFHPKTALMVANGFGKRASDDIGEVYGLDNFWEMLESSAEKEGQDGTEEKTLDSIPVDYFVNEILNNPDFARSVVRKFIDLNQDGTLSTEELLRNVV